MPHPPQSPTSAAAGAKGPPAPPLGKLYFDPRDFGGALKCLAAARMTKRRVETEPKPSPLQFELPNGDVPLRDAFAIAWFLSSHDQHRGKRNDVAAQALAVQWSSFSASEIKPFLRRRRGTDDVRRLVEALDVLNENLMRRKFLAGAAFTLADVCVAADLAQLMDPVDKGVVAKHHVYVSDWYAAVASKPPFKAALAEIRSVVAAAAPPEGAAAAKEKDPKKGKRKWPRRRRSRGDEDASRAAVEPPLRVLCLHGYRQNENAFREKLGAFRKVVGKMAEFTYITAPHHVLPMSNEDINQDQRGWWFSRENDYFKADDATDCDKGFEESLKFVERAFEQHGPFDGIMGFSQGGALAAIVCLIQHRRPDFFSPSVRFDFAVFVAAFRSTCSRHSAWYDEEAEKVPAPIPTLHVMGADDRVIDSNLSEQLLGLFQDPEVVRHAGGHFVPATGRQKPAYVEFLRKAAARRTTTTAGASTTTTTDENQNKEGENQQQQPVDEAAAQAQPL